MIRVLHGRLLDLSKPSEGTELSPSTLQHSSGFKIVVFYASANRDETVWLRSVADLSLFSLAF